MAALAVIALHQQTPADGWSALLLKAAAAPAGGGGSGGALSQRIARLEAESRQIEAVRLRAEHLDRQIASLERRGNSGSEDEAALAAEAARLKDHLSTLAKDAHLDPSQVLRDYPGAARVRGAADAKAQTQYHYIDDDSRTWPAAAHAHHYIDDDSREVQRQHTASSINVGVLGRTATPKHKPARGRHHYIDDTSWKAAPKLNQWGEEQLGKKGAKRSSIGFYNYGNPTKLRPWQYGPKESAFGEDFVRGVKGQKDISFGNSWKKVAQDDSWKIAPEVDSLLGKLKKPSRGRSSAAASPSKTPVETKAWAKAKQWFDEMREKTAEHVKAARSQEEEVNEDVRKQVEARVHHFSRFDKSVTARVANDLKMLQEARAAEAALRKSKIAPSVPSSEQDAHPSAAKQVSAGSAIDRQLSPVPAAADDDQTPKGATSERDGALSRTERMLNAMVASAGSKYGAEESPLVTAEQRAQRGWQRAAHEVAVARASMHVAQVNALKTPDSQTEIAKVDYQREAQAMQDELRKARAEVAKLPDSERGAAESAIKAMEGTLEGAKVTAATLERNEQRARVMGRAAKAAAVKVSSLETDPVVQKAEAAQEKVWRLQQQLQAAKSGNEKRALLHSSDRSQEIHRHVLAEAAEAAAQGAAAKVLVPASTSRLAKLGINTGEGVWGDDWGGDQVAPAGRYH